MGAGVVEWHVSPASFTTTIDDKPLATPLARLQADQGYRATNLRGEMITLDEIHRQTLRHLDGKTDFPTLTERLINYLKEGRMVLHRDGDKTTITEEKEMRAVLGLALEKVLTNLARQAFFVSPGG